MAAFPLSTSIAEWCERPDGPQSLIPGPLKKKFADPWSKISALQKKSQQSQVIGTMGVQHYKTLI